MLKNILFSTALVLSFLCTKAQAEVPLLFVYSEQYPPYSWIEKGEDRGMFIDIAREVLEKRLKMKVIFKPMPWARTQAEVKNGTADAFITTENPERQQYAFMGSEKVLETESRAYTSSRHPKISIFENAKTLNDLKDYQFVGNRKNKWQEDTLKSMKLEPMNLREDILRVLKTQRVDLWVEIEDVADYMISKNEMKKEITKLKTTLSLPQLSMYFYLSKKTKQALLTATFDRALKEMKKDGSYQKILEKYKN